MSTSRAEVRVQAVSDQHAREWINGFLLLGILVGLTGSLIIAWQYHIDTDPQLIGLHFLALNTGYVAAASVAQRLLFRISIRAVALAACALGFASLLALTFAAPPVPPMWRIVSLGFTGAAGGALATALLYAVDPYFKQAPAALASLAGVLFGCGCLISTAMVAITYFAGSVKIETALLAPAPLIYFVLFANNKFSPALAPAARREEENRIRETLNSVRSMAAVLFSLLLFFQFGNEWSIAGWLPLFLIHRVGANPVFAVAALAVYFAALTTGRLAVRKLLPRVSHRKLLLLSVATAMVGCLLLSFTPIMAGAWLAALTIGAGFAPIYPLIAESLDDRFAYHPGFYNGIFSIAITGAMSAPWLLGYINNYLGIRFVMLLPALGSIVVLVLALLLMLEARLMGSNAPVNQSAAAATAGKH